MPKCANKSTVNTQYKVYNKLLKFRGSKLFDAVIVCDLVSGHSFFVYTYALTDCD